MHSVFGPGKSQDLAEKNGLCRQIRICRLPGSPEAPDEREPE